LSSTPGFSLDISFDDISFDDISFDDISFDDISFDLRNLVSLLLLRSDKKAIAFWVAFSVIYRSEH
jgi:hypothetical protein